MSSTLQERWVSNGSGIYIYCNGAQTFTVTTTHLMDELRLRAAKGATTPQTTVTIDLYSVDGSSKPDTLISNIGSIDTDTLTTSLSTKYFYPSIILTAGIEYALVFTITGSSICQTGDLDIDNNIKIGGDSGYSNGIGWEKVCALNGSWACAIDWTTASVDFDFREYGEAAPSKPTNPTPAHAGTDIDFSNKTLSWEDGGDADTYNVYVGDAADNLTLLSSVQAGLSLILTDEQRALFTATGHWRVDATNGAGTTTGDAWYFTCAAPGKAQNPTPVDTAEDVEIAGVDKLKLLQWEAPD